MDLGANDGYACEPDTLHLLYALVRYLKPALIVEAGTYRGASACVMAQALKDSQTDGVVWTADVEDHGALETVERNKLQDYISLYRGDFVEMLAGPLASQRCRFAFVDSGSSGGGEVLNTATRIAHCHAVFPILKAGGILAVDDAAGQWDGVQELRDQASLYLPNGRGLILVQRRG